MPYDLYNPSSGLRLRSGKQFFVRALKLLEQYGGRPCQPPAQIDFCACNKVFGLAKISRLQVKAHLSWMKKGCVI